MTAPRQIVLLSTDFRPMTGGVADHLHRLAAALASRLPVTVMTSVARGETDWERAYRLEALPPVPERSLDARLGDRFVPMRKVHTAAYWLALRRYGRRTAACAVNRAGAGGAVVIGLWDMAAHFWCAACRRSGVPYYLLAHGAELLIPMYGSLPAWRARDFQRAAGVIANSSATATMAAERLPLPTVPAIVNPSVGPRPPHDRVARAAAALRQRVAPTGGPAMLSVGRLVPRKGFDLVLRSLAALSGDYPTLSYVMAGDGPERGRLEALARDLGLAGRVHFLGRVDDETKWAAYDACDVFVMPNRLLGGADWEGFGIVFLEAALSTRPSIAGRTGGAADAVSDEETGLLVDPEAPGALTGALRRLLSDDALRERLGRAGEAVARTRFTGEAMVDRMWTELGWN